MQELSAIPALFITFGFDTHMKSDIIHPMMKSWRDGKARVGTRKHAIVGGLESQGFSSNEDGIPGSLRIGAVKGRRIRVSIKR